ncbi:hypothetical protein ACJO1P_12600 [Vibrio parahaemolyticus]|uniref:hypothetical protein n=1 Tax=Vibrio parahaemolyticus TaxID=670 RepID=UPI00387ACA1F
MTILTFEKPEHFLNSLTQHQQIAAFALGGQNPKVYVHLKAAGIPQALAHQQAIERLASHFYQTLRYKSDCQRALDRHHALVVDNLPIMCEDVTLHLKYPELPLVKYYSAIQYANNQVDIVEIWERHFRLSRALCFAIHHKLIEPRAQIGYAHDMVLVELSHQKQSFCYVQNSVPLCFHVGQFQYFQLPLPWTTSY